LEVSVLKAFCLTPFKLSCTNDAKEGLCVFGDRP
jgi:hypothetical protein